MNDFKLTPKQNEAIKLLGSPTITNVLLFGGSRCIAGDTQILTDKGYVAVRDLHAMGQPFVTRAFDEKRKQFVWAEAEAPFVKGKAKLYRVTLANGTHFDATGGHRVLTASGYESIASLYSSGNTHHFLIGCDDDAPMSFNANPTLVVITDIKPLDGEHIFYDLTVPTLHNYVAEGIVHHNSGKTAILVYTVLVRALKAPGSRHLILRLRFNHAKQSLVYDTIPKIAKLAFPGLEMKLSKVDWFYTLPNGSEIWIGGLDDGERVEKILGNEYATIYFNESSQLDWKAIGIVKTRLAMKCPGLINKLYFDCNPPNKRHWTYKLWIQKQQPDDNTPLKTPDLYACMRMNPTDNAQNLAENYIEQSLISLSERDRKRFLMGEFGDDAEGALFKYADIAKNRVVTAPEMRQVVVGCDPAVTSNDGSNNTGIVVAGVSRIMGEDHYYVLDDATISGTPASWAREAINCFDRNEANLIIGEVNQGGDLIEANLRAIRPLIPYEAVRATRGKAIRAEPVATACEKGRLHFVGEFPELENELTSWAPASGEPSPDRMDALVWAIKHLMGNEKRAGIW